MSDDYKLVTEKVSEKELVEGEYYEEGDKLLEKYQYDNFDAINNY